MKVQSTRSSIATSAHASRLQFQDSRLPDALFSACASLSIMIPGELLHFHPQITQALLWIAFSCLQISSLHALFLEYQLQQGFRIGTAGEFACMNTRWLWSGIRDDRLKFPNALPGIPATIVSWLCKNQSTKSATHLVPALAYGLVVAELSCKPPIVVKFG